LFINNRYSGYDLWVDGTYADYGVSWMGYNMYGQNIEVFLGQTYDFNDRSITDPNSGFHNGASDVVGRVTYNPRDWVGITNRFRLGRDGMDLRHNETNLTIGRKNFITVGYIWAAQFTEMNEVFARSNDISEGVFGLGTHLTNRLQFKGNMVYNFTDGVHQRYNVGLYYEHPCWSLHLVYTENNARRTFENDDLNFRGIRAVRLNFAIKVG
jgi:LPS-assembly protein